MLTIHDAIQKIEECGIECRPQSTYFGDEIAVHLYGNNERAVIYSPTSFLGFAAEFLKSEEYKERRARNLSL